MDCNPPGSSVPGDSLGKNTAMGSLFLLQGIFPTQGSNPGLLHCRQILNHRSHQGINGVLLMFSWHYAFPDQLLPKLSTVVCVTHNSAEISRHWASQQCLSPAWIRPLSVVMMAAESLGLTLNELWAENSTAPAPVHKDIRVNIDSQHGNAIYIVPILLSWMWYELCFLRNNKGIFHFTKALLKKLKTQDPKTYNKSKVKKIMTNCGERVGFLKFIYSWSVFQRHFRCETVVCFRLLSHSRLP